MNLFYYFFKQKEDPKQAFEIKSLEQDYDRRHAFLQSNHESVIQAQRVKLDEIPLPDLDAMPLPPPSSLNSMMIPPPPMLGIIPPPLPGLGGFSDHTSISAPPTVTKSILKRTSDVASTTTTSLPPGLEPPGPPPSSPPSLSDFECDDDEETEDTAKKSIRFGGVETTTLPPKVSLILKLTNLDIGLKIFYQFREFI